jgi:hypothetical protein
MTCPHNHERSVIAKFTSRSLCLPMHLAAKSEGLSQRARHAVPLRIGLSVVGSCRRRGRLLSAIALHKIVADDWNAEGERQPHEVLHEGGSLLEAIVNRIGFRRFRRNDRGDILQKIHAALFTLAALALRVLAGGAFVAHGAMASLAEASHFADV